MNYYNHLLSDFKRNYMLYIPLSIILQSCIGSIAAMYVLMSSTSGNFPFFQLSLCVVLCMLYNAAVLAQLNCKWVFNILLLSIFVNVMLCIIYI